MPHIELITLINAPIQVCFDLSRSAELHMHSTSHTNETVVDGRNSGLFVKNDTVTWRAKHFGIYHQLKMKITDMNLPYYFEDCMLEGIFKSIRHQHFFSEKDGQTEMKDVFIYTTPYGSFGRLFDNIVLRRYMKALLIKRNDCIKSYAETGQWKTLIK